MRKKSRWNQIVVVAGVLLIPLFAQAQGTAFTYQGYLDAGGAAHDGLADFEFSLWDTFAGGVQQGSTLTESGVEIENGLFTVELDFGDQFPGAARWLEIAVRTNAAAYTTLTPRQRLTATPYAITAGRVSSPLPATQLSGTIPSSNLGGTYSSVVTFNNAANTFAGDGSGLSDLDASELTSGTVPAAALDNAWKIGGNTGTTPGTDFIGTADDQALELHVNNTRALRIEPNTAGAPNIIGGAPVNFVGPGFVGATIGGGGATNYSGSSHANRVLSDFGTIGGGWLNTASRASATVGGGWSNLASGVSSTVAGGQRNIADNSLATVSGGERNTASGNRSTVGGGALNTANSMFATVGGGQRNTASADRATVGGGSENRASGTDATVGGGWSNIASSAAATVSGGEYNTASGTTATVGGGDRNIASGSRATVGGGWQNTASSDAATVSGGWTNTASGSGATVGGGTTNTAIGTQATIGGGRENMASGAYATVGGGWANAASDWFATVSGGERNTSSADSSTVAGGWLNTASGGFSVVGGGFTNTASGDFSVVGGGQSNIASNQYATVPGGHLNTAGGTYSFAAGRRAKADHDGAFVWGDSTNEDFSSTRDDQFNIRAAGGVRIQSNRGIALNEANTPLITRGGNPFSAAAPAAKQGHGRWGLFMEPTILTIGIPEIAGMNFRVSKYAADGTSTPLMTVDQFGNVFATFFAPSSSREKKENFHDIDPREVLAKVTALPVTRWSFKGNPAMHIGPMSEDFHAAFGLNGQDDKHIVTSDISGVALAAIQGLNLKVEDIASDNEALRDENQLLRERLEQLEQLMADHLGIGSL